MPKQVRTPDGTIHNFPDDATPEEIDAQLNPPDVAAPPAPSWFDRAKSMASSAAGAAGSYIREHPAQVGGTLGAVGAGLATGGVGAFPAMVASGLGGAAGAAAGIKAHDVSTGTSTPPPTALREMGEQGLAGAAGEGVGRVATAAASGTASWLMNKALSPSAKLAREFPELAQTAIDHALTVTKGGYEAAQGFLTAARQRADDLIAKAQGASDFIHPHEIASAVADVYDQLKTRALGAQDVGKLQKLTDSFLATKQPMTLTEAQALKRSEQQLAQRGYRALDQGTQTNDIPTLFHQAIARGAREALETRVPGLAEANRSTQALLGTTRAIGQATSRGGGIAQMAPGLARSGAGALVGGAVGYETGHPGVGAALGAAASTPAAMSRMSILLSHPIGQAILRQLPKPLAAAVAGEPPSVTSAPGGPPTPPQTAPAAGPPRP
jgi:hypothetical protein